MIINRIYETQNLLSLQLVSFLAGLRTYQPPCIMWFLCIPQKVQNQPRKQLCTCMPMHICTEQGHKCSCVQNHMQVFKWWSTFRFVHHVMVKCSNTVEEPTASVFMVANVVKADGEAIQGKNHDTQSSFRVSDCSHVQKAAPSQWELRFLRMALFSGFTNGINRNVIFGSIHYLDPLRHPCLK